MKLNYLLKSIINFNIIKLTQQNKNVIYLNKIYLSSFFFLNYV